RYFSPFVVLLDRDRTERKHRLAVEKQDEWYTYLTVTPKAARRSGWRISFESGGVAVMNKDTPGVPAGMPRVVPYIPSSGQRVVIDIRSWRLNVAGSLGPADFTRPEDRPGWTVADRHREPARPPDR